MSMRGVNGKKVLGRCSEWKVVDVTERDTDMLCDFVLKCLSRFRTRMPKYVGEREAYFDPKDKNKIIDQALKDVMLCWKNIFKKHRRNIIDYAVWHCKNVQIASYAHIIAYIACCCIVHSNFFASDIQYVIYDNQTQLMIH